jgi:addiction module HigA family antidote
MEMFNPPHPGEIVREDCMVPAGLSVAEAAAQLGVSRQSVSELINGHNGVSVDMALRLEKMGWGSAEGWIRSQGTYDLWQARHRADPDDEAPAPRTRFKVRWRKAVMRKAVMRKPLKTGQPKSSAVKKPKTLAERKAAAKKAALKKNRYAAAKRPTLAKRHA